LANTQNLSITSNLTQDSAPTSGLAFDLGVVLLFISLPLFPEFSKGLTVAIAVFYSLYFLGIISPWLKNIRWLPPVLLLLGVAIILRYYRTLVGYEAGIALYTMLLSLKLLETRNKKDFNSTVLVGLFLIVLQFLLNQSLPKSLYMLPLTVALFATLIQAQRAKPLPRIEVLKLALRLVAQALPLMLVVFILFPRLSSPLWSLHLKLDRLSGRSGLENYILPGAIGRLVLSQEVAFRAELQSPPLPASKLYWRGLVFWRTKGLYWHGSAPKYLPPDQITKREGKVKYRIILEPNGKRWVLALDLPAKAPKGTKLQPDLRLLSKNPIDQRTQFFLVSFTDYQTGALDAQTRIAALQLPLKKFSPRLKNLIATWQQKAHGKPDQIVAQALAFFRSQGFVYTLSPPALRPHEIERFLFETKAGFCEHYASTFSLLMRLAGIPSRVVGGYLGGEYNELGKYYLVRQSSAHAWSEVWLEGSGWVRVDPTAVVAPERVQNSIANNLGDIGSPVAFRSKNFPLLERILHTASLTWDAINTRWHIWVLGYDNKQQDRLLDFMGLGFLDHVGIVSFVVLICFGVLAIVAFILAHQKPQATDIIVRLYQRFERRLSRIGLVRLNYEGPQDFAKRVMRNRPDIKSEINTITGLYMRLRYSKYSLPDDLQKLKQLIQVFRPKRYV